MGSCNVSCRQSSYFVTATVIYCYLVTAACAAMKLGAAVNEMPLRMDRTAGMIKHKAKKLPDT